MVEGNGESGGNALIREEETSYVTEILERGSRELPAMPAAVSLLLQAARRDMVTSNELEGLISIDPSLAGKTLRFANSAYYGLPRQVRSLNQAIIILGVQQIRNLALSLGAASLLKPAHPRGALFHKVIWSHCFQVACASRGASEALALGSNHTEDCFLLGLLHDVGHLFLLAGFSPAYLALATGDRMPSDAALIDRFKVAPYEIGSALLSRWNLPERICSGVKDVGRKRGPDSVAQVVTMCHHALEDVSNMPEPSFPVSREALVLICGRAIDDEKDARKLLAVN